MTAIIEWLIYVAGSLTLIALLVWSIEKDIEFIFKRLRMWPDLVKAIYKVVQERKAKKPAPSNN